LSVCSLRELRQLGSRLTSASNPESGTIYGTYLAGVCQQNGYDADGLLITKTAPRPNQTRPDQCVRHRHNNDDLRSHASPASEELLGRVNAESVTLNYDESSALGVTGLLYTMGRASSSYVTNSLNQKQAGEVFSYDQMGRVKINSQCTPQNCPAGTVFPINYTYDLLGDMATSTNGMGVTLTYTVNRATRVTTLGSSLTDLPNHPNPLFSQAHFNASGSLLLAALGNGVNETRSYDGRLRLSAITDGTLYTLTIPSNGYAPNSDILQANDSVNRNWTYAYDAFNRLASASKTGSSYTYDYDRFGNRWHQNGPHAMMLTFSGNNNRMDGYSYDAAGNLLNDGAHSYTYDAENRIQQVDASTTASYVYDASGRRVRKTTSSGSVDYLYDLAGQRHDGNHVFHPRGLVGHRASSQHGDRWTIRDLHQPFVRGLAHMLGAVGPQPHALHRQRTRQRVRFRQFRREEQLVQSWPLHVP